MNLINEIEEQIKKTTEAIKERRRAKELASSGLVVEVMDVDREKTRDDGANKKNGGGGVLEIKNASTRVYETVAGNRPEIIRSEAEMKPDAKPDAKKSGFVFTCGKCSSLDGWLPRAPGIIESDRSAWRCWHCQPAPSPQIVSKRVGPLWLEVHRQDEAERLEAVRIASGSRVVAAENAVCVCGCSWVIERPSTDGFDLSCWSCQSAIDVDRFEAAISGPARWRRWHWKH
jgi:hypothetical protein